MNTRTFKSHVVDIIWDAVKAFSNVNRSVDTSMTSRNNGFYFKFHQHAEELQLLVYPEGNLGIKVRDYILDDQLSSYYKFREEDDHEKLLPIIREDLTLLVKDFYGGLSCKRLAQAHIAFSLFRGERDWMEDYRLVRPGS